MLFNMEGKENYERKEIFSRSVRAGRRTYFFDVRSTKAEDYYMQQIIIHPKKNYSKDYLKLMVLALNYLKLHNYLQRYIFMD